MGTSTFYTQAAPITPPAGQAVLWVDATTKKQIETDDAGHHYGSPMSRNWSTASQGPGFAADTYVTNSGLLIPSFGMQAGQHYRWIITGSKTGAGTAAAVYAVRIGSNQSTADTARLTLTASVLQTAVADNGTLIIVVQVRNVGAAGVIAGAASWAKTQAGTIGLGGSIDGVSASFDNSALAGQYVGLSINGGAAAAWTLTSVHAELMG